MNNIEKKEKSGKKVSLRGIGAGIAVSVCLAFMLCIYAPLEMFLTNQDEFWFSIGNLILPVAVLFLAVTAVCVAVLIAARLINETLYYIGTAAVFTASVATYIQGNFFVNNLPPLDGTAVDWNAYPIERIKSVAAWVLAAVAVTAVLIIFKKEIFRKVTLIGGVCLTLLLAITLGSLFLTTKLVDKDDTYLTATDKGYLEYSTNESTIVLVLDAVDEEKFYKALYEDSEAVKELNGFTYFDDALACYPFTMHAIPSLFSGKMYENDETVQDYIAESLESSPFLKEAEAKGYKTGIYIEHDMSVPKKSNDKKYENQIASENSFNTFLSAAATTVKVAGIKFAPWDLKRKCYNAVDYSAKAKKTELIGDVTATETFSWWTDEFYQAFNADGAITTTSDKTLRFIHVDGAHVPFHYNKQVDCIKEGGTYYSNVEACVTVVREFVKELKKNGVYDNSSVMILADHGYDDTPGALDMRKRAHPVLLAKGVGESGEMKISGAPVSLIDIADAVKNLMDGSTAEDAFPYKDGDKRERTFYAYLYTEEDHMVEYKVNGKVDDMNSFTEVGSVDKSY